MDEPALMNPKHIQAAHIDLPTDVTIPEIGEIMMATREINRRKTTRPDDIPDQALKLDIEVNANILHVLFGKIWEEEHVPPTD
ncbi:unnamed protein product [Schistosoma mattheei]|uniref:Uncharacterized protein n=1 Tax=Schistosoma mattheei TaxID=31246 RepID=A0A183NSW5_9TREM|nr:unnamed protein product [Schistosoma mattheei]